MHLSAAKNVQFKEIQLFGAPDLEKLYKFASTLGYLYLASEENLKMELVFTDDTVLIN